MGFFSWLTCDTNESISNCYSNRGTFEVRMLAPDGRVWVEPNYEGYGVFGGKDYHELVAELNGKTNRDDGIDIQDKPGTILPKFARFKSSTYDMLPNPVDCPFQGYFYVDDSREDEEDY